MGRVEVEARHGLAMGSEVGVWVRHRHSRNHSGNAACRNHTPAKASLQVGAVAVMVVERNPSNKRNEAAVEVAKAVLPRKVQAKRPVIGNIDWLIDCHYYCGTFVGLRGITISNRLISLEHTTSVGLVIVVVVVVVAAVMLVLSASGCLGVSLYRLRTHAGQYLNPLCSIAPHAAKHGVNFHCNTEKNVNKP